MKPAKKHVKRKKTKRSWTPVYLKTPNEAFEKLEKLRKDTGKSQVEIFLEGIEGGSKFGAATENYISEEMQLRGLGRKETIEQLLAEAVILKRYRVQRPSET